MSDIFREVDEALQKEKAAKIWKDYGPVLIMGAITLVVFTGIFTAYRTWDSHQNKIETAKLVLAAEDKDIGAAMENAALDTRKGHKAIALMNAASKAATDNDFKKASSLYESVASDKSSPLDLRHLSTILYVRTTLLIKDKEDPDYKILIEKLEPVANSTKGTFQNIAKLETALLYGDGLGDYKSALAILNDLKDESNSSSIKEKAQALNHIYNYELSKNHDKK